MAFITTKDGTSSLPMVLSGLHGKIFLDEHSSMLHHIWIIASERGF